MPIHFFLCAFVYYLSIHTLLQVRNIPSKILWVYFLRENFYKLSSKSNGFRFVKYPNAKSLTATKIKNSVNSEELKVYSDAMIHLTLQCFVAIFS